jgi:hypothetical protein
MGGATTSPIRLGRSWPGHPHLHGQYGMGGRVKPGHDESGGGHDEGGAGHDEWRGDHDGWGGGHDEWGVRHPLLRRQGHGAGGTA